MQFEAIYNQGKLEFSQPIHFRHDYFTVTVDVPEQEISVSTQKASDLKQETIQTRIGAWLDGVVGKEFRQANNGKKSINCKAIWHEHLEEKYLGR